MNKIDKPSLLFNSLQKETYFKKKYGRGDDRRGRDWEEEMVTEGRRGRNKRGEEGKEGNRG